MSTIAKKRLTRRYMSGLQRWALMLTRLALMPSILRCRSPTSSLSAKEFTVTAIYRANKDEVGILRQPPDVIGGQLVNPVPPDLKITSGEGYRFRIRRDTTNAVTFDVDINGYPAHADIPKIKQKPWHSIHSIPDANSSDPSQRDPCVLSPTIQKTGFNRRSISASSRHRGPSLSWAPPQCNTFGLTAWIWVLKPRSNRKATLVGFAFALSLRRMIKVGVPT